MTNGQAPNETPNKSTNGSIKFIVVSIAPKPIMPKPEKSLHRKGKADNKIKNKPKKLKNQIIAFNPSSFVSANETLV